MAEKNDIYPLFFTVEKVRNGYILTIKEKKAGTDEYVFCKEVVAEDKIDARVGKLFQMERITPEYPIVFHVEAVSESTYNLGNGQQTTELAKAKLAYTHICTKGMDKGKATALRIQETGTVEVWGDQAERAARSHEIPLSYVGIIPMLSFPNTKEGLKAVSATFSQINLTDTSNKEISEWYISHKVMIENGQNL